MAVHTHKRFDQCLFQTAVRRSREVLWWTTPKPGNVPLKSHFSIHALIISTFSCSNPSDGSPVPTGLFSRASVLSCDSTPFHHSPPTYSLFWPSGLCGFFCFSIHWPREESWGAGSQTLDCLPLKSALLITVLDCSLAKNYLWTPKW